MSFCVPVRVVVMFKAPLLQIYMITDREAPVCLELKSRYIGPISIIGEGYM